MAVIISLRRSLRVLLDFSLMYYCSLGCNVCFGKSMYSKFNPIDV